MKDTLTGGLTHKLIRLRKIGEAVLDLARLAPRIRVPQPAHTAIQARVQDPQAATTIRMKGVRDLKL